MKQSIYVLSFILFINQIILIQSNGARRLLRDETVLTATEEERKRVTALIQGLRKREIYPKIEFQRESLSRKR